MKAMDALSLDVSAAAIHPLAAETTPTEAALNEEAAISLIERDTRGTTAHSCPDRAPLHSHRAYCPLRTTDYVTNRLNDNKRSCKKHPFPHLTQSNRG